MKRVFKKICILVPTYENAKAVNFLLDNILVEANECNVDIYICDSSASSDIKNIFEQEKTI